MKKAALRAGTATDTLALMMPLRMTLVRSVLAALLVALTLATRV